MKRFLALAAALAAAAALALVLAPLALGGFDKNKPTTSDLCPNSSYTLVQVTEESQPADVNGDDLVCMKTVADSSNGGASGPQYIDNTAHNQTATG